MKKKFAVFLFLFLLRALSAQNLNFNDTNSLAKLLCRRTWVCYKLNSDSSFSNIIRDSIRFFSNKTWNESGKSKNDTVHNYIFDDPQNGDWVFGTTGGVTRSDTATDCIFINMRAITDKSIGIIWYTLVDGRRIKGTKRGRVCGNIDGPFLIPPGDDRWKRQYIWQPRREIKKAKKY